MRKGASRNMQRIGLKVTAGVAPHLSGGIKQPPVAVQQQREQLERLARIRRSFQLEQQIQVKLAAGENVAELRETLAGVKTGRVAVPLALGRDQVPQKRDPIRTEYGPRDVSKSRRPRPGRTLREMQADLVDISKGRLTLTGASVIKGLVERFDREFVDQLLEPAPGFLDKVIGSAFYSLSPDLEPNDGWTLLEAMELRGHKALPKDDDPAPAGPRR